MKPMRIYQKEKPPNKKAIYAVTVIGSMVALTIAVLVATSMVESPGRHKGSFEQIFRSDVLEVATDLTCSCNSCGEMDLVKCFCKTATRQKKYIEKLLERDFDRATIIAKVESKFGM